MTTTGTTTSTVLVTGGAGYVGAVLVPKLLAVGYRVRVLDLYLYGAEALDGVKSHPALEQVRGDVRDQALLERVTRGCDAVVHLACISNDPSFDLKPALGRSINLDAFRPLVSISRNAGVRRFVYASSSSVYGVKMEPDVHEGMSLEPLTDYSRYKAACEQILAEYQAPDFTTVTLRPATVCGYSPRQRLDVVVNIMTNLAFHTRAISVFGGSQQRPNIHIADMVDSYLLMLQAPSELVAGQIFNVGDENRTVMELAETVKSVVGDDVTLVSTPTNDNRSYHVSSKKIAARLGWAPRRSIREAVLDLTHAFEAGMLTNTLNDDRYFNVRRMQRAKIE